MNTELGKKRKTKDFQKDFFKMMNSVFGEIMENLRKHGDIDIEISVQESTFLVSKPNYHTKKRKFRKIY